MRRLVIVIDTQWDFMAADGALSVAGAGALVAPMRAWLAALDPAETAGVLFTFDTHDPVTYTASPEAAQFPIHCVKGTSGWQNLLDVALVPAAIPAWRLEKSVFDMWAEPDVAVEDARDPHATPMPRDRFFEALEAADVRTATVIGVAADYCVRWAVEGLVARGWSVTVPAALTRGIEREIDVVAAAIGDAVTAA